MRIAGAVSRGRTLWTACAAHALHDGYTDLIYLLLPIWQAEFGLGYGALAFLRGLAAATMAGLQVPAGRRQRSVSAGAPRWLSVPYWRRLATCLQAIRPGWPDYALRSW